jgi:cation transporter-like permease
VSWTWRAVADDTTTPAAAAPAAAAAWLRRSARFDPAITAVPLMTTCVDSTGLVIYFFIAQLVLGIKGHPAHG